MVWHCCVLVSLSMSQNELAKYKIRMHLEEGVLYTDCSALAFRNLILRMLRGHDLSLFDDRAVLLAKNRVGRMEGKRRIRRDP